jgi:hypothetical protein
MLERIGVGAWSGVDGRSVYCGSWCKPEGGAGWWSGLGWSVTLVGVYAVKGFKNGVRLQSVSVIYLLITFGFKKYMEFLYCVHVSTFGCEMYGGHNGVNGAE